MPPFVLIAILAVAAILFAVPVRRLALDGRSGGVILGYVLVLAALAFGVSEARPLTRYLLPILGLVYIAPFITFRGGIDRLLGRRPPTVRVSPAPIRSIAPPRDVTSPPPEVTLPEDSDDSPDPAGGPPPTTDE